MDAFKQDRERQHIVAAVRRYHQLAWRNNGRAAMPFVVPLIVLAMVPGWWWALTTLAIISVAAFVDWRTGRWIAQNLDAGWPTLEFAQRMQRIVIARVTLMTALHATPYFVLLFAPTPGPIFSLVAAASIMILMANMQIITRRMILMTSALPIAIASIAVGMVTPGWVGWALAAFCAGSLVQAARMAAASSDQFNDLVEARLDAEAAREVLELRVEERTASLRAAVQAAEDASKAKSMFLANMSHELRTPLNAVIGYSEIIEEDLESGDVSECPHHISRVRGAGKHLLHLIADILDVAKADADRIQLVRDEIDAAALARAVMDTIAPAAASNCTGCEVAVEPGLPAFEADALRVKQCLLNLASNAAKFTRDGRITLRVRAQTWQGAGGIAFEVADTGIGISDEVQARLFEPFVQADASVTREFGGTGLGLSIARRFARLMGGDITLQSKLGEGSRFTLILPLTPPAQAESRRAA